MLNALSPNNPSNRILISDNLLHDLADNLNLISTKYSLPYDNENSYILYINIKKESLNEIINSTEQTHPYYLYNSENYFLLNSYDTELVAQDIANTNENFTYDGTEYFAIEAKSEDSGLLLLKSIPLSLIEEQTQQIKNANLSVSIFSALLILGFSLYIYFAFYMPIKKLDKVMEQNELGVFTLCKTSNDKNELNRLQNRFNAMIKNVKNISDELLKKEIVLKNSKIMLLQSQINPHFLYNMIDIMRWMAKMNKTQELSLLMLELGKYYRYSLSDGKDYISVEQAIQFTEAYFNVIKIHVDDKINLIIDVDTSLYDYTVPKMLLQPIVENCVNHAFVNATGSGTILVLGMQLDDSIKFIVEDDGVGIKEERLNELKHLLDDNEENEKFYAIKNLQQQLKLNYGPNSNIEIKSEYSNGTQVHITIDKKGLRRG